MVALVATRPPTEPTPAPASGYEAVFVRAVDGSGQAIDLVVIGVDGHGNERQIARLPDRGDRGQMSAHLVPMGAGRRPGEQAVALDAGEMRDRDQGDGP
jgi:phosphoheptose isomerase